MKTLFKWVDFVFGNEEEVKQLGVNLGYTDADLKVVAPKLSTLDKTNNTVKRFIVVTRGCDSTIFTNGDNVEE